MSEKQVVMEADTITEQISLSKRGRLAFLQPAKTLSRLPMPNFRRVSEGNVLQGTGWQQDANITQQHLSSNLTPQRTEQSKWRSFFSPTNPAVHRKTSGIPTPVRPTGTSNAAQSSGPIADGMSPVDAVTPRRRVRVSSGPAYGNKPKTSGTARRYVSDPVTISNAPSGQIAYSANSSTSYAATRGSAKPYGSVVTSGPLSSGKKEPESTILSPVPLRGRFVQKYKRSSLPSMFRPSSNTTDKLEPRIATSKRVASHKSIARETAAPQILRLSAFESLDMTAHAAPTHDLHELPSDVEREMPNAAKAYEGASASPYEIFTTGNSVYRVSTSDAFHAMRDFTSAINIPSSPTESDFDQSTRDDGGFDSTDDAMYDSIRTRATSMSSAVRAISIEKLFISPSDALPEVPNKLASSGWSSHGKRHSTIEEELTSTTIPSPPSANANTDETKENLDPAFENEGLNVPKARAAQPDSIALCSENIGSQAKSSGAMEARSNIFDWAERDHLEKDLGAELVRPRTVHGKKHLEGRGSRSTGRHVTPGLHVRSQSVPVVPDNELKRSQVVTNKFGTWGVGSKGVTEDWNEDFDFEDTPQPTVQFAPMDADVQIEKRLDSAKGMVIPATIREQQSSVLANIGLLRDWGLLIEELKDLKARAASIDSLQGQKLDIWHEVDAMIELADHESHDHTLAAAQSPPSSPSFNHEAFDEFPTAPRPVSVVESVSAHETALESPSTSPSKKMLENRDLLPKGRPRKDSEAVARSVIEALQQKRNISDPTFKNLSFTQPTKKVPFDTATLRRIVPHVQELRDRVKQALRDAERLYDSPRIPDGSDDEPLFSRIFHGPDTPTSLRSNRLSIATQGTMIIGESNTLPASPIWW